MSPVAKKTVFSIVALLLIVWAASRNWTPDAAPPSRTEPAGARLSQLLGGGEAAAYAQALQPRPFHFPRDHGPHPEYRNEWWYLTGNLDSESGQRFGFELTFFRFALSPGETASDSNWRTRQVYIAHFAVTDKSAERFHVAQKYSRAALGLAGAQSAPFRVWLEDWSVGAGPAGHWELSAGADRLSLHLDLLATKPPVLNGVDGLSQKSAQAGIASYYYSIPRLQSRGTLQIDGETYRVSGLSWLDREWGSSALAADQQGWDWFALQLSDGSDLMFYNLRKNDGSQDEHSAGTWVPENGSGNGPGNGQARRLDWKDLALRVTGAWQSPAGGAYPAGWEIRVPDLGLELTVTPILDNQELFTTVRYWEGAVDVSGRRNGQAIGGRGYVELTGYAR